MSALGRITRVSHITYYYSLMFFIAYAFKGQVHVFAGREKIVSHTSCWTSAILKYLCPLMQPRHDITYLQGFGLRGTQTSLLSYRDWLENWNFACRKFKYDTFQKANNKGAYPTAQMRSLVYAFVVRKSPSVGYPN